MSLPARVTRVAAKPYSRRHVPLLPASSLCRHRKLVWPLGGLQRGGLGRQRVDLGRRIHAAASVAWWHRAARGRGGRRWLRGTGWRCCFGPPSALVDSVLRRRQPKPSDRGYKQWRFGSRASGGEVAAWVAVVAAFDSTGGAFDGPRGTLQPWQL